ncbi:MAG: oligopeptide transporter, OPT family [Candidatus Methylophosphatis roskildensis]
MRSRAEPPNPAHAREIHADGPAELTVRAVLLGTLLGVLFGASSLYLVLKVGLTVSASIPVAVISIALFRLAARAGVRDASMFEHVAVQTTGSAGESIAFGLGVTMPAILILGFDLEIWRVMLVATLGGLLGILMMLPLRRTLIVAQHRELSFPEGTACAQVLLAADAAKPGGAPGPAVSGARTVFIGFAIGLVYKIANIALKGWKDVASCSFGAPYKGASIGIEVSPELLGVGYIIGPRIAATMCAGGVLAYLVLMPLIHYFGSGLEHALAPAGKPIREMGAGDLRGAYILYIGAGAVAMGGLVSLIRALPLIARSLREALGRFEGALPASPLRTEREIGLKWVFAGWAALLAAITLAPPLQMNLLGALLIAGFGFLFCTVSARLTGEIGSSSNPISGMTIATLLVTCLIFRLLGWTAAPYFVTALSIGAIVCIASANAGTTAQDLKTGYLVGATPRAQQIAILLGSLASALALGPVLLTLNDAATVYVPAAKVAPALVTDAASDTRETLQGPQASDDAASYRVWHKTDNAGGPVGKYLVDEQGRAVWLVDPGINGIHTQRPDGSQARKYDAPKAVLVSYLIKGILQGELPWALVIAGAMIALVLEMAGVASLAFAVGLYLPLSTSAPILFGGLVRAWSDRRNPPADHGNGVLLASGYIAGGALAGIVIAIAAGVMAPLDAALGAWAGSHNPLFDGPASDALSVLPFAAIALVLMVESRRE